MASLCASIFSSSFEADEILAGWDPPNCPDAYVEVAAFKAARMSFDELLCLSGSQDRANAVERRGRFRNAVQIVIDRDRPWRDFDRFYRAGDARNEQCRAIVRVGDRLWWQPPLFAPLGGRQQLSVGLEVPRDSTAWFLLFGRRDDKAGYARHVSVGAEILDIDGGAKYS